MNAGHPPSQISNAEAFETNDTAALTEAEGFAKLNIPFGTLKNGVLSILVGAAILVSANAQTQRIQLQINDQQTRISLTGEAVRLAPAQGVHPLRYLSATNIGTSPVQWKPISTTIDPKDGSVTLPTAPASGTFYTIQFPNLTNTNYNYFLRIPSSLDRSVPQTLAVVMAGDTPSKNPGAYLESFTGGILDQSGVVSLHPSPVSLSTWNGDTTINGSDYAYLLTAIRAAEELIHLKEVVLVGYSHGSATEEGLAVYLSQIRPGLLTRVLFFAAFQENIFVPAYFKTQQGGQPIKFDPPIQCVCISADGPSSTSAAIAKFFALANGYTGISLKLPGKIDIHDIPGPDTVVYSYGPNVCNLQILGADHDSSQFLSDGTADGSDSSNGVGLIYENYLGRGLWPIQQ